MGYWLSQIIPSQDNPKTMHLWTVQLKWTLKVTSQVTIPWSTTLKLPPLCCGSKTQRFQAHLLKIWPQDSLIENCQIFSIKESLKPTSMDFLQGSLVWSSLESTLLLRLFHSTNTYQVPTVCQALVLQLWYRATPFFSRSAIPVGWSKLAPRQDRCIAQIDHLVLCSGQYTVIQL